MSVCSSKQYYILFCLFSEVRLWEHQVTLELTQIVHSFDLSFLGKEVSDIVIKNKWELMGLDKHLQVSVMSNLFGQYVGASNYVNDLSDVTRTFLCQTKSREERLDVKTLISQKILPVPADLKQQATHVVVGVIYGAQTYCVVNHDNNEDVANLLTKWKASLTKNQGVVEFKDKFDNEEKQRFNNIKCRVYADLHPEAVRDCSVYEAYKQTLILVDQFQNCNRESKTDVPIAVLLCPIEAFTNPSIFDKPIKFYEPDIDLVARCHLTWEKLERIRIKADGLRAGVGRDNRSRLRRFVDAIVKYQEDLKKNLKEAVIEARMESDDAGIEKLVDIVENHRLFSPSKLKRWLFYETSELKMMEELVTGTEISFVAVMKDFDPKPTSVLLYVPSLNRDVISEMEGVKNMVAPRCSPEEIDYSQDGDTTEDEEEKNGIAFHSVQHKRKLLESKIQELKKHIERNNNSDSVQYFVTNDSGRKKTFCYFLYGEEDEKNRWFELPKQPKDLRIQPEVTGKNKRARTTSTSIRIKWDYQKNETFPCHFLVDYRPEGNVEWTRKKTNEMHLAIEIDSAVEVRVAAECCVGFGPYTDVIDSNAVEDDSRAAETPTVRKQAQITEVLRTIDANICFPSPTGPKIQLVTSTTADIVWTPPEEIPSIRFRYTI